MKRFHTTVVMALSLTPLSLTPSGALAQERVGDAALGGLSGALILGPVGAVAGIVVGYAAGPDIGRSWGLKRSGPHYQDQGAKRTPANSPTSKQAAAQSAAVVPPKAASATKRAWNAPPVMGFE
jgi:hypothetical protein